jgi:hypothetical protein
MFPQTAQSTHLAAPICYFCWGYVFQPPRPPHKPMDLTFQHLTSEHPLSHVMNWTNLPPEIFETILRYLDLDTVKALRLTN